MEVFTVQRFKETLDQLHPPPLHLATFSNWQKLHSVCLKNRQPLFCIVISKISYLVIKMKRTRWRCQRLCQRTLIPPLWHRTCSPLCLSHFLNFIYIREDFSLSAQLWFSTALLHLHRAPHIHTCCTAQHSHSTAQHSTGWQRSVMRKWNSLGEGDPGCVKMVTASWETDLMSSRQLHNIKEIINLYALFTNVAKLEYTL